MSIIESLTEGMVHRDMAKEGQALLNKWSQTGLLEGITDDQKRSSMARLLENQAKELLREASTMASGDVEGFAAVAFPIVRRVFAGLIANDLVSVQPMSLPSGLIFFLDFVFSPDIGGTAGAQTGGRFSNLNDNSIYGGNRVGANIRLGVELEGAMQQDLSGPRTVGARGYAYGSPEAESTAASNALGDAAVSCLFKLDGNVTEARQGIIDFDADLLSRTDLGIIVLDVAETFFPQADFDNMGAWTINDIMDGADTIGTRVDLAGNANLTVATAITNLTVARRLTQRVSSDTRGAPWQSGLTGQAAAVRFFIITDEPGTITESNTPGVVLVLPASSFSYPERDDIVSGTPAGSVVGQATWALENTANIPEIDIKVDSVAITAQTKKLKAKWTPELGQDLNAYHNLDAEVELTSILSEQIALEIDREIIADLVNGATASTLYWSRSPGLFVNRTTGAELGVGAAVPDFTGTVSEWYETLIETINDVSAQIHRKTLRGGANFVVCGPEVANILEFTAGFRANVTADADKGEIGAVKVGSLSRKFDVIVDPYFLRNVVLVGRRGSSFLESGYVYAPYVPLQVTPTIFGTEDFVPRKGVMTRYGKKMVRPDMYGLVVIRGLLGESGQT